MIVKYDQMQARSTSQKGSTSLQVTGNPSKRQILTNTKWILTKRMQRIYKLIIHSGEEYGISGNCHDVTCNGKELALLTDTFARHSAVCML